MPPRSRAHRTDRDDPSHTQHVMREETTTITPTEQEIPPITEKTQTTMESRPKHETSEIYDESYPLEQKHEMYDESQSTSPSSQTELGEPQISSRPEMNQLMTRINTKMKSCLKWLKWPARLGRWSTLATILLPLLAISVPFMLPSFQPYVEQLDVTHPHTIWQLPTFHIPSLDISKWSVPQWLRSSSKSTPPPPPHPAAEVPQIAIVLPIQSVPVPVPVPAPESVSAPESGVTRAEPWGHGVTLPVSLQALLPAVNRLADLTPEQREMLEMRPDLITSDLLPPLNNDHLGRAVWTFLHTVAAAYSDEPTTKQQLWAMQLIESISEMYPSTHDHFKQFVKYNPPSVSSKTAFSVWLCRAHNHINLLTGRPSVNCDPNHLAMLWPNQSAGAS